MAIVEGDPFQIFGSVRTFGVQIEDRSDLVDRQEFAYLRVVDEAVAAQTSVAQCRGVCTVVVWI